MQVTTKSGILLAGACIVAGFGSGLLVGRQFPPHHYEKFGNTSYLLDPTTGKVCNPFADPNANPMDANLFNQGLSSGTNAADPLAKYEIAKPTVPPCGK